MAGRPIHLVAVNVDPDREAEFNDFYHHRYIPNFLTVIPEFVSARRYESIDEVVGPRRFLSLYEARTEELFEHGRSWMARPARASFRERFSQWEREAVQMLLSDSFREVYTHPREPADGPFGSRPIYLTSLEIQPEQESAFFAWYHGEYLPRLMADLPAIVACRGYASTHLTPSRFLTVLELPSLAEVPTMVADLRGPSRRLEQEAWRTWCGRAITRLETGIFRPIFRLPG